MPDLQEDTTGRRFIPTPANAKPSVLFWNTSAKTYQTPWARFVNHKDVNELLIFISGLSASVETAPERAVYAYVWGPHADQQDANHEVAHLEHDLDPQTAERANILAATKALRLVTGWCDDVVPPRSVVLAFSGNSFLNHVARSDFRAEVRKGADDLDMKYHLGMEFKSLEAKGVTVRFWQIDRDNRAEALANTLLYSKERPLYRAVKKVLNST